MAKIVLQKIPDARAYITLSEAITAGGVAGGTIHIVEPVTLDQNATVSGCTIKVTEPGYINLGNFNLTFDSTSRFDCPYNYQAFYYTGSGVVTFASESVPYVAVKWFPDFSKAVSAGSTILLSSSVTLTANYSGGAGKHLIILKGGSIIRATYTFEWTGTLDAGNYQVFSGFGAGDLTLDIEYVYPQWIGTISEAVTALGSSETTLKVNTSIDASDTAEVVTIPTNLSVQPVRGGVISKGTATGLTINGPVVGDPKHQWLSGFAAGDVTFAKYTYSTLPVTDIPDRLERITDNERGYWVSTTNRRWKKLIPDVLTSDFGFSTTASRDDNTTAFTAALTAALAAGRNLFIDEPGIYPMDSVTHTLTGAGNLPGIKIYGPGSMSNEYSGKTAYLDFSALTGTATAITFANAASSGGQIIGMILENLGLFGPDKTGSTKGIMTSGNAGIRNMEIRNVRAELFGIGALLQGPNHFGLHTSNFMAERNGVGMYLSLVEASTHDMFSGLESIAPLVLSQATSITFNSPILQTNSSLSTGAVFFKLAAGDSSSIIFNSPYFEGSNFYPFNIGYSQDGSASTGYSIWGIQVNGGVYSLGGTSTQFLKTEAGVGSDSHSHQFNNIVIQTAAFNTPDDIITGPAPYNTIFTLGKGQDSTMFVYDNAGIGPTPYDTAYRISVLSSLPAAGASNDGRIVIHDAGAGDRNLIIYAGGERFMIDGGAPM